MNLEKLRLLVKTFPHTPGVYLMKGIDEILYIGKSKDLKNRVNSYIQNFSRQPQRIKQLISKVETIEFIKANNEMEALILENNLIKKNQPFYNVALKDNKTYPYIRITNEPFPAVSIVRKVNRGDAIYFGPFSEVKKVRTALNYLLKMYPLRTCKIKIELKDIRPCIYYDIGRCPAPCASKIDRKRYNVIVRKFIRFIRGHSKKQLKQLEMEMYDFSEKLEFERAAEIRDRIKGLEILFTKQIVEKGINREFDVIGYWQANEEYFPFVVLMIREGAIRLVRNEAVFYALGDENDVLIQFLQQYYLHATDIPEKIYIKNIEEIIDKTAVITKWLSQKHSKRITFLSPKTPQTKKLLKLAVDTAKIKSDIGDKLLVIKQMFKLHRVPKRIEGYDISNFGRDFAVGSMVVFKDGKRDSDSYRRFRIKFTEGINDYGMMEEVLKRRFSSQSSLSNEPLPDLLLIDGGLGHLNTAGKVVKQYSLNMDVMSIAKKEERIYTQSQKKGYLLDKMNPALLFLMYIRDEAHRYGLNYNIKIREKIIQSKLRRITGLADRRIKTILTYFPDIYEIKKMPTEKVSNITHLPKNIINKIKDML